MKSKFLLVTEAALVASLLLGACSLPALGSAGYATRVLPPAGSIYPLGTAITLRGTSQYAVSLPAVIHMNFWANGRVISGAPSLEATASGTTALAVGAYSWTPPAVGEYLIQAEAIMPGSRISISPANRICVLDINLPPADAGAEGYEGQCPLPPARAFTPGDTSVTMLVLSAPDSIVFPVSGVPGSSCPQPSLTFTATLHDPAGRVALVLVEYDVLDAGGAGGGGTLVLNPTSNPSPLERTFANTLTNSLVGALGNLVDDTGNATAGTVRWTAHAFDRTGVVLATVGPNTIAAGPCIPGPTPHVIQPFPTDTPTMAASPTATPTEPPTLTPTALVCPQGTILDPQKNACFYASRTPKPTPAGPVDCSSFGSAGACKKNGCSWDDKAASCSK